MHHYRSDETDVLFGTGTPSASRVRPTLYIDVSTGIMFVNLGGGSTWRPTSSGSGSITTLTATSTLTAADSGKTFILSSSTEFDTVLPALAAGLRYSFIIGAAPSGASYTITPTDADKILGQVYTVDVNSATDPDFEATGGGDVLTFVDAKAVAGDSADFYCDGTNWYVRAFCSVFDAITITG